MEDSFQEIIMTPSPESATPGPTQTVYILSQRFCEKWEFPLAEHFRNLQLGCSKPVGST